MASASFDWAGYLSLADYLASRPDEAARRSAISRAYYYVYNIALRRAEQNGFVAIRGESTHTQLVPPQLEMERVFNR